MKSRRIRFAVVLDEYGGLSGIVTINDLLEQLVGDFDDEAVEDNSGPEIERVDSHTWRIQGSAPLDEVAQELHVELPLEEYDTFGGLVFGALGAIPNDGAQPELEAYGLQVKVQLIQDHRVQRAVVCLLDPPRMGRSRTRNRKRPSLEKCPASGPVTGSGAFPNKREAKK